MGARGSRQCCWAARRTRCSAARAYRRSSTASRRIALRPQRERRAMRILLAVDGSKHSLKAVDSLVEHASWYRDTPQVELVTVHLPVPRLGGIGGGVSKAQVQKYYQEEGEEWLAPGKKKLDAAKVRYTAQILVGPVAESLVKHAKSA